MSRANLSSWCELTLHAKEMKKIHMKDLFAADSQRFSKFSLQLPHMLLDYSKNLVTTNTMDKLNKLEMECAISQCCM